MANGWIGDEHQAQLRLASSHLVDQSRCTISTALQWAGTRAVAIESPLNRAHRDISTMAQHSAFAPEVYSSAGKGLLSQYLDHSP
jgi:hypothetical protein